MKKTKSSVTQNDVAREAGVTRSMVSYVISGNSDRSVAPETRKRILDAIERLGYRPNKAAQALQQGDIAFASNKIGVVLCTSEMFLRPYYAEIISGIHLEAHEQNCQVSFIRFFEELKNPVLFNTLIHEEEIGGLILVAVDQCIKTDEDKKIVEKIKERLSRIVCVEFQYEGLSSVMFDRQETARRAAEYLIERGFSSIGYIGENDERVHGVQLALSEGKLEAGREKFYLFETFDMNGGFRAVDSLFASGKMPRAVVCGSDEVAIGVLSGLSKRKISVPQEVAVISMDNIEISEYTCPPLTTMNVQKKAMGEQAVKMIVSGTAGKDEQAMRIMLPSSIVVRESC
ncbi:LacI family DNA-binding transcriptional regulator [Treponema sp.]|uniref:LacI family DNA-binding transcriptional regulator n=1 Tax=Treponema sp. TaxID=166 RepID=UPI003EFBCAF3